MYVCMKTEYKYKKKKKKNTEINEIYLIFMR